MKKRIYFKGYYGFKNIGDDIFCVTADWVCNRIWGNKKPIFIGKELPNLSNNSIKKNISNYWLRKLYEFIILFKSERIIYFGGTLFSKVGGIKDIKYILSKFPIFHSKLGTIGTSIGPFKDEKDYESIKYFLSNFKFISVRDYSSLEMLNKMKLNTVASFSFDTAILIKEVYPALKTKRKKNEKNKLKIAISLCHYERYVSGDLEKEKEREDSVTEFISRVLKEYNNDIEEIVFFEFNGSEDKGDLEITNKLYKKFSNKVNSRIVSYTTDTLNFIEELNNCDFLIGMRLHAGILAYTLNLPFMLVEYHNKCTEFLNTVNHKYRYYFDNQDENLKNFHTLFQNGFVPNIEDPKKFENILLNELKELNKVI